MAVPVVFLGSLGLAFGILWAITHFGDPTADGAAVQIEFSGSCMEEATPLLLGRATQVGMPATMEGTLMTTTLPDIPEAEQQIPDLLITQGELALIGEGVSLGNDDLEDVAIELDNAGMPQTLLKLDADARALIKSIDDKVEITPSIDGEPLPAVKASTIKEDGIVTLHAGEGVTAMRMKRAADRAIILAHGPLPCAISVRQIKNAADKH